MHNEFASLLETPDPAAFLRDYRFDVSPVSDDRPFFFYTVQPRDVRAYLSSANRESADYKINMALPLLFELMATSLVATALILGLPRLLLGAQLPREHGVMMFLLYFLCLGAGYIMVQVALIQRFVLLLGHPAYALTVIVFSMLVASGTGSFFSAKWTGGDDTRRARCRSRFWRRSFSATRGNLALAVENAADRSRHRPRRIPDGNALSKRPPAVGAEAFGPRPLGLVAQRRGECAGLRGRHRTRDLHRLAGDAFRGWSPLFSCHCSPARNAPVGRSGPAV
jgi:hypothetical protein